MTMQEMDIGLDPYVMNVDEVLLLQNVRPNVQDMMVQTTNQCVVGMVNVGTVCTARVYAIAEVNKF